MSAIPQFARQNPLPPSSFAPKQIDQLGLNLGASRLFWRTGGRLSFQLVSDFSEQKGLENIVLPFGTWLNNPAVPDVEFETGPPTYYQSRLLFSYSQPLFQNFSGTLDRLGFEVSQTSDLGIGLAFSYPLGNRTAARQSEKFSIMLKQLQYTDEEVAISLEAGLRNLLVQSEEIEKALDLNKLQIATATRKTEEEQKRYNQGRSDLAFVIQSQDSEEQARLTYAEDAARYQLLQLKIMEIMDQLLPDPADFH